MENPFLRPGEKKTSPGNFRISADLSKNLRDLFFNDLGRFSPRDHVAVDDDFRHVILGRNVVHGVEHQVFKNGAKIIISNYMF